MSREQKVYCREHPPSLKASIDATDYTCLDITSAPYEKKGLFGRK